MTDVEALQRENALQRAQIATLIEQVAKLNERIGELLAIVRRKHRKPSVPKETVPPPSLDAAAKVTFEQRPKPPALPEKTPRTKQSVSPSGR